jgi:hypothetical protein
LPKKNNVTLKLDTIYLQQLRTIGTIGDASHSRQKRPHLTQNFRHVIDGAEIGSISATASIPHLG